MAIFRMRNKRKKIDIKIQLPYNNFEFKLSVSPLIAAPKSVKNIVCMILWDFSVQQQISLFRIPLSEKSNYRNKILNIKQNALKIQKIQNKKKQKKQWFRLHKFNST